MEKIELKSTQSRFCDSNVAETSAQTNACLNIESESVNQSVLIEEDNKQLETFVFYKDLEVYITNTTKLVHSYQIRQRINELISKAKERINKGSDLNSETCFFKRKEPIFTLKSVECFNRIVEKKFYEVNYDLVKYFELVLIYESVTELSNDKETLVKLINLIFMLIKSVDCPSTTYLIEYRLQITIKKVLLYSSEHSHTEIIKNALTPLLLKEDSELKKSQLTNKLSELVKKKINGITKKEKHDEALKELSDFIKEKFTSNKEHYEIMLEPLLDFFDLVTLENDIKYNMFYEYLCYFVFPLLPNLTYMISKNETKQEQKPFGLYNPVLMIKNMEVATKTYTLLNFIDNNIFDLKPQFNLTFYNLDILLSRLSQIFNDENSKSNVNLRFALFVIYKRIILIKEYSHLFTFNYSFAEIEHLKSTLEGKKKTEEEKNSINSISNEITREVEGLNINSKEQNKEDKDFHDQFIKAKLSDIINVHDVIRKISIISLDMFRNKVDSESNEISNFFPYIIEKYEEEVCTTFKEFNFDIADYVKTEKLNSLIKYMPSIFSEKLKINQLSALTEGLLNTIYITAGNKKDFIIYAPRNSVFYFTCTITYYDALVNIYKYDPYKEGTTDKFVILSKEQKIESDFTPFEVTIFSYKPEIYKINIDNTFSWLNGKEVKYKMSILQLSEQTKQVEAHKFALRYKLENFKEQVLNKITEYVFFKYETFLGKNLEDYAKKGIAYNYLNSYSYTWLQKFLNVIQKNKEPLSRLYAIQSGVKYIYKNKQEIKTKDNEKTEIKEEEKEVEGKTKTNEEDDIVVPQNLQEIGELQPDIRDIHINFIKNAYKKISSNLSSLGKGKKQFKLDKLASIDIIIRSYIKNVFVRVNLNEEELEDHTFKSEICKFEDVNDQFIFFNYFYLKQNKNFSLGNYFEDETINNSNIIFMKFPLVDSCLIYYLYICTIENSKLPEKAIYFHFDKSLDKFNYAVYSDGEILGDDICFGEGSEVTNEPETFYSVIKRTIDAVNFRKINVDPLKAKKKKKNKKNNDDSEESEESEEDNSDEDDDDDEKTDKLRSWKIISSFTGSNSFIEESTKTIKSKVGELNKEYFKEGKTKKEKKIKTVFKSVEFVCDMTNFMHCFEIY